MNHWIVDNDMHLWRSSRSKQGQLELRTRHSLILNISMDEDSIHNLAGEPMFHHLSAKEFFFLHLCLNGTSCVTVCTSCLSYVRWAPLRSLALTSSLSPTRYLYTLTRPLRAFSQEWTDYSALSLSSHDKCSKSFGIFVALCQTHSSESTSLFFWGTQNWTSHSRFGLTKVEWKTLVISLKLLWQHCLMCPGMLLASFATSGHC